MPKYYDRDTKVAYVLQIEEGKLKVSQAARDLGVAEQTIYNWIKDLRSDPQPDCPEAGTRSRMSNTRRNSRRKSASCGRRLSS